MMKGQRIGSKEPNSATFFKDRPFITTFQGQAELDRFVKEHRPIDVRDIYRDLLRDRFLLQRPRYYFATADLQQQAFLQYLAKIKGGRSEIALGKWVYFPWVQQLFHLLDAGDYYRLRTLRNRYLVSSAAQQRLHNCCIAIAGLSVGKNMALTLLRYGIGKRFHLADADRFELSNMNRAIYDLFDYRQEKLRVVCREMYQIDPFVTLIPFSDGLTDQNIERFVRGAHLIVDAFDQFPLKVLLRQHAKRFRIPVISGADVEKGVLLVVERYDLEPHLDLKLFLNKLDVRELQKPEMTPAEKTQFFISMIGKRLHSPLMLRSVLDVGTKLTGYPQLIVATQLFAAAVTVVAEAILLGKRFASFRTSVDLPRLLRTFFHP